MNSLNQLVAVVTGAGSGLGEATAKAFGREGSTVICADIHPEAAGRVCEEICNLGGQSMALQIDVSDATSVADGIRRITERFGRVDVAVNNAAIDHTVSVDEMSVAQWDQVIGVNLRGPFLMAKTVFPHMREQGGGHIVNVASTAAKRAWANAAAYHASKWGLVGFSRGLGVEGRPHGIKVTTIIPGGMRTHFFDRFESQGIPMPEDDKLQDPANVAEVILCAVRMPGDSALQEAIVTPVGETSWP